MRITNTKSSSSISTPSSHDPVSPLPNHWVEGIRSIFGLRQSNVMRSNCEINSGHDGTEPTRHPLVNIAKEHKVSVSSCVNDDVKSKQVDKLSSSLCESCQQLTTSDSPRSSYHSFIITEKKEVRHVGYCNRNGLNEDDAYYQMDAVRKIHDDVANSSYQGIRFRKLLLCYYPSS